MKLSISLPDEMAEEVRDIAEKSDRSVSWWVQRAWRIARAQLREADDAQEAKALAMHQLQGLAGSLKTDFPSELSSIQIAKKAFEK